MIILPSHRILDLATAHLAVVSREDFMGIGNTSSSVSYGKSPLAASLSQQTRLKAEKRDAMCFSRR